MKKEFGNFAFADALQKGENKEQTTQELFDRVLRGKMEKVPAGSFESQLSPIESVTIIPVRTYNDKTGETRVSLNAVGRYQNADGVEKSFTWSVYQDGLIHGDVPKDVPLAREAVAQEILLTVERMHVDFWHKTDLEVLPGKDEGEAIEGERQEGESSGSSERPIKPERLEFLEKQERVLFGFVDGKNGFRGYHAAVFPDRIVLEHPRLGNAAFVVPLTSPIEIKEEVFKRPPGARVSDDEVNEILGRTWEPISRVAHTRKELQSKCGASRIVHNPGSWEKQLQEAIDALPEKAV